MRGVHACASVKRRSPEVARNEGGSAFRSTDWDRIETTRSLFCYPLILNQRRWYVFRGSEVPSIVRQILHELNLYDTLLIMIGLHYRQGLAHDKVREMRELILQRYDKNFDGRLEINEVCVKTAFGNANQQLASIIFRQFSWMIILGCTECNQHVVLYP